MHAEKIRLEYAAEKNTNSRIFMICCYCCCCVGVLLCCCVVVVVGVAVVSGNVWLGSLVEGELFTNKRKKERPRALFCSVPVTSPHP